MQRAPRQISSVQVAGLHLFGVVRGAFNALSDELMDGGLPFKVCVGDILALRCPLDVVRVDAVAPTAGHERVVAFGWWTDEEFVCSCNGVAGAAGIGHEGPTRFTFVLLPYPAVCRWIDD